MFPCLEEAWTGVPTSAPQDAVHFPIDLAVPALGSWTGFGLQADNLDWPNVSQEPSGLSGNLSLDLPGLSPNLEPRVLLDMGFMFVLIATQLPSLQAGASENQKGW